MKKTITLIITILISTVGFTQIDTISYNIYQNNGNLGIGTSAPSSDLEIIGDGTDDDIVSIKNNNYSRYAAYSFSDNQNAIPCFVGFRARGQFSSPLNISNNDRITGLYGAMYIDGIYRVSSAVEMFSGEDITSTSSPSFIKIGTTPKGSTQRVERMRIDPQGNIGINSGNPSNMIELKLNETGSLFEKGFEITRNNGVLRFINGTNNNGEFQPRISGLADSDNSPGLILVGTPSVDNEFARGIVLRAGEYSPMLNGNILEIDNYTTTLVSLNSDGFLGVGTDKPFAKLHVQDGDIYISDIEKGIIMKSPDGQCWRGTLDNFGNLSFIQITCPEVFVVRSEELKSSNQVLVFPNPTENNVRINIENIELKKMKYSIFDVHGKMLEQGKIKNNNQLLDISSFDSGMYLIKINDKKGNLINTTKVIKK